VEVVIFLVTLIKFLALNRNMKDNLEEIKKIPLILEVKRIKLTKLIKERLGPHWSKGAIENNRKIFVYRIIYNSKWKKIVGYMVEPRKGKNYLL
tara:strand:- start:649 stop:930 length:282 start_codon:yes stop_codon:yes gene_type:complete